MMRKNGLFILAVMLLASCSSEKPADSASSTEVTKGTAAPAAQVVTDSFDKLAYVEAAKAAIKQFGGELKAELTAAVTEGGPENAIEVCNTKAGSIAEDVSAQRGLMVSRVSMKNRHPDQAPTAWQQKVLETFDTRKANGEDVTKMVFGEVVTNNGKKEFHFMKAIPTAKVCLACHGETVTPEVEAKLKDLYPEDKARGYNEGDIRGAFVVVQPLD